jgi:hypothetical protein
MKFGAFSVISARRPPVTSKNSVMTCSDIPPPDAQRFYRIMMLPWALFVAGAGGAGALCARKLSRTLR